MNLDDHLGLVKNPFSKKSSEQELDFLDKIFYVPNYYQTLLNDLSNGDSRFIIGQRGHGKSSIINKLFEDLESANLFVIKIDRFDSIPLKKNETALLKLIIKYAITKLSTFLINNKGALKNLTRIEKEKLAFLHRLFYGSLSKTEYKDIYNCYHKVEKKNWLIRFFNSFGLGPANAAASAIITMASDAVRQSIGLDKVETGSITKEYFGKLKEIDISKIDLSKQPLPKDSIKALLDDLLEIVKNIGFKNTVVLFDKIDEFQDLSQDITKISNFTKEILSDTELLMNANLAIGFSLWSELRSELAGRVRFDKFGIIDVSWVHKDMEPLINKRIGHFSNGGQKKLLDLIPSEGDKNNVIHLANKSPRDLISALAEIYQEQSNMNSSVGFFDSNSVHKGLINFCSRYDYDSLYPQKHGKNKEITAMINRLLYMQLSRFTIKQLTETYNQNNAQSEGQVKIMIGYKLVREDDILGADNTAYYEVVDPKVEFLIKNAITKIE